MDNTQLELLKEVNRLYGEVLSLTELILRVDPEERPVIATRRGEIIDQCQNSLALLESLPAGGALSDINDEKKRLKEMILATVSQDAVVNAAMTDEKDSIKQILRRNSSTHRAADAYRLNSRSNETL